MGDDERISPPGQGIERHVVVLSDVHLGTDHPTAWYQRDVHEEALVHLLGWVADQAEQVAELVLLGDVVDFWTYPAHEPPPTFAAIRATHPAIFGPTGALARVLDALDGRVTYVPGNHDMGITAAEVASIASPGGHHVRLVQDVPYHPLGANDHRIALAHGHHHTLFNAPHADNPWAPLPVGYFVTRAVATGWARRLDPGQTVADLAGQGAPNGLDLRTLGAVAAGLGAKSITAALIDFVSGATGMALDEPITMPDGSTATLADARVAYADCWTDWVAASGGGYRGTASAYRAAMADLDGSYLGWFAQRAALPDTTELVVMGHTHVPVSGLRAAAVRYVNSGFDCPSKPDRDLADPKRAQRATFAVIDTDALDARVWEVAAEGDGHVCRPVDVAPARVVSATGMDFSCYVTIDNTHGERDLSLERDAATYGSFVVPPPGRIRAGEVGRFWLQDSLGPSGSSGTATYTDGTDDLTFTFACPTFGTNSAAGWHHIATRSDEGPWRDGEVVRFGHPFFVRYEL
ncbi:MAG: metallophosphoesterase [Acidimicrobiales bacterium]